MELRHATPADLPAIIDILDGGRTRQRSLGFTQWPDGYPSAGIVETDIRLARGYLFSEAGSPVAYAVLDLNGDREYDAAPWLWPLGEVPYAAVHRLAMARGSFGRGLSTEVLRTIAREARELGMRALRAETGECNLPMQRALERAGYRKCGHHVFSWGPRVAYELDLTKIWGDRD